MLVEGADARVQCVRSRFSDCGVDGIAVLDGAHVQMEGSELSRNGANGLYVRGYVALLEDLYIINIYICIYEYIHTFIVMYTYICIFLEIVFLCAQVRDLS